MLEKMKSAWRIPELRKKIIYTFGMHNPYSAPPQYSCRNYHKWTNL